MFMLGKIEWIDAYLLNELTICRIYISKKAGICSHRLAKSEKDAPPIQPFPAISEADDSIIKLLADNK